MKRRDFIKIVSLSGGGLILAGFVPSAFAGNDSNGNNFKGDDPDKKGVFAPGVFVRIDSTGLVTIIVAKSEMGQGVYTALPMIVAEELDVDWEKIVIEQAPAGKEFGSQTTGGSTSVRFSFDNLRKAGATARMMLISAAALVWKTVGSNLYTESGFVIDRISGKKLSYGELVDKASGIPVPSDVKLKDPKDYKLIGKKTHRKDTPSKIYGTALFGIDVKLPGMLYAAVKRNPLAGLGFNSYDFADAMKVNGVVDFAEISGKIAVIAKSTWQAFKAAEKITVDWKTSPANEMSTQKLREFCISKLDDPMEVIKSEGKSRSEIDKNLKMIQADFELPYLAHAPVEPMNCTAEFKDGKMEIWAPTQNPQGVRKSVSQLLKLSEDDVRVNVTFMGGGFGRRLASDFALEAAEITYKIKKPVKVTWTREDDMRNGIYRPFSFHRLRGAVNNDGGIEYFGHHVISSSIWGQQSGNNPSPKDAGIAEGTTVIPYKTAGFHIEGTTIRNHVPLAYWRSVFHSQNPFAVESFIDELAHSAGTDPLDFRIKNLHNNPRLLHVIKRAAEISGWGSKRPDGTGVGIAVFEGYDSYCAEVAEVTVAGARIKVNKFWGVIDCGLVVNPDTVEAQMEGAIIFALTAALKGKITFSNGTVDQSNFDDYPLLSYDECPAIQIEIVRSSEKVGGVGEVGIAACAPALCNAIFAASGKRMRVLPLNG